MAEAQLAPTEVMTLGAIRMQYIRGLGQEEIGPGAWIKPTIVVGVIMGGLIFFGLFVGSAAASQPQRRRSRAS